MKQHKDVEFHVSGGSAGDIPHGSYHTASVDVMNRLLANGEATLDVIVSSPEGAYWLRGDDGVEAYSEDPDASVFERYAFKCNAQGRVP